MRTASDIESMILRWLTDILGAESAQAVDPEESFFAHGLDSLAMVNLETYLSASLETPVSVEVILDHPTPRQLAECLAGSA